MYFRRIYSKNTFSLKSVDWVLQLCRHWGEGWEIICGLLICLFTFCSMKVFFFFFRELNPITEPHLMILILLVCVRNMWKYLNTFIAHLWFMADECLKAARRRVVFGRKPRRRFLLLLLKSACGRGLRARSILRSCQGQIDATKSNFSFLS